MPKCWPTYNRHNKLSSNGRMMNECCSTNYSTIALTEESTTDAEKIITWTDGHKIGQLTKKGQYRRGLGWWTADCRPNNPILASKTVSHWYVFQVLNLVWQIMLVSCVYVPDMIYQIKIIILKLSHQKYRTVINFENSVQISRLRQFE